MWCFFLLGKEALEVLLYLPNLASPVLKPDKFIIGLQRSRQLIGTEVGLVKANAGANQLSTYNNCWSFGCAFPGGEVVS